jgi:hypothetical protein
MRTYLLLRSNKQTGPYSFDELLTLGLRAQDLLWVEGKSASWRYPSELDELRAHVPAPVMEPMPDSKTEPAPAEAGPAHQSAATFAEPTPEKEIFHFHPRIRVTADHLELKETMHFHPRLNGGSASLKQGEGDADAFPTLSRFMQTAPGHPETGTQETIGGPTMSTGMAAPDFYPAKPPADAEDEVPSLALQAAPEHIEQPKKSPAEVSAAPRIQVTLPAAVADKTLVIIHPREQHPEAKVSAPEQQRLQESNRRPVLEFLEDFAHEPTAAPAVEPVLASSPVEAVPENQPLVDHHPVDEMPAIIEPALEFQLVEEKPTIMEPALESQLVEENPTITEPALEPQLVEETPVILEAVVGHTGSVSPLLSPEAEIQPAFAVAESGYALPSVRPKDTAGILQKIAVAAAIISLVSVAALIANSVFNPNAYNYETKSSPVAPVRKQPAPHSDNGAAMVPGNQDEPGSAAAGDSDQSVKSETAGDTPDNQAKPAVKKIE